MKNLLRNKHVKWHTNNYASSIIAKLGRKKRELQQLVIETFKLRLNTTLDLIFHGFPEEVMS